MEVRPKEVDEALDYLLDYECFTPYISRITLIRDYILELEEKNNIRTELKMYREIIDTAEEKIKDIYGAVIVEGYADIFDQLKEIRRNNND